MKKEETIIRTYRFTWTSKHVTCCSCWGSVLHWMSMVSVPITSSGSWSTVRESWDCLNRLWYCGIRWHQTGYSEDIFLEVEQTIFDVKQLNDKFRIRKLLGYSKILVYFGEDKKMIIVTTSFEWHGCFIHWWTTWIILSLLIVDKDQYRFQSYASVTDPSFHKVLTIT